MVEKPKYDAFISYSHTRDRNLAKSLQTTLERWGSAVPGRRPLRVFRDESNLSANPDLWETIKEALNQSGYFIWMASPESARSPWVKKEIEQFVGKDAEARKRIGIVLTAGTLPWMKDEDPSSEEIAIVPEVSALSSQEPLVVDLRSFRESRRTPEFAGRVATLVAAILGKDKDEVFGDHLTAQRRFITALVGGIVVLALAIVLALLQFAEAKRQTRKANAETKRAEAQAERADKEADEAKRQAGIANAEAKRAETQTARADKEAGEAKRQAVRADKQAERAIHEAQRADARAREAISRRLANEADRLAEARIDGALLLMAQAQRMADNSAIRSSWWRLLGTPDMPLAFLPVKARSIRFEPDGNLAVTLDSGSVTFRETDGIWRSTGRPPSPAWIGSSEDRWEWSGSCDEESPVCSCSGSKSVILDLRGDQDNVCVASTISVPGWCSGQPFEVPGVEVAIRREESSVYVKTDLGYGELACLDPPPGDASGGPRPALVAGDVSFFAKRDRVRNMIEARHPVGSLAESHDGRWLAVLLSDSDGGIEIWSNDPASATAARWGSSRLDLPAKALSVASSRRSGAVAVATASVRDGEQGGLMLWQDFTPRPGRSFPGVWNDQRGSGGALALSDDGDLLVGGVDVELPVFRTSEPGRPFQKLYIGRHVATSADFSGDGRHLVVTLQPLVGTQPSTTVFSIESGQQLRPFGPGARAVAFHPTDGDTIVTAGDNGVQLWSMSKRKLSRDILKDAAVALAVDRATGRLAVGLADGDIAIWDREWERTPVRSGRRKKKASVLSFMPDADALLWASDGGLEAWYWLEDTWLRIDGTTHAGAVPLRDGSVLGLTGAGQAVVYELDPARWLDRTCNLVGRNLSRREWSVHIGEAFPYKCTCPEYGPGAGWPEAACKRLARPEGAITPAAGSARRALPLRDDW